MCADASGSSPPAALLAVAGPSGWLGVYRASLPGPNSWHLLHSNSSSSGTPLAGPITAVAFSPAGDTLAVAGPAAQILGTDATAIAAAGGAPGAVSLYSISSSNNGYQGGAGAAVSQGQQRELQLWQQWCLRSLAISLLVLPSSGVQLTAGQEVGAVQVSTAQLTGWWIQCSCSLCRGVASQQQFGRVTSSSHPSCPFSTRVVVLQQHQWPHLCHAVQQGPNQHKPSAKV